MTSFHDTTPARCPSLIDEDVAFRKLIARLFTGDVREVIGEMLQNSQRAGATQIDFAFPDPTHCCIRDDGHGLTQGLGSLYRLLRLVDTYYENEGVEANQAPMGVGFYSLLALPGVRRVRIESRSIELEIETDRWFNDRDYRETWPERVRRPATPSERGLRLTLEGEERTLADLRTALISDETGEWEFWGRHEPFSPARGYAGILTVLLDGSPVDTALPSWFSLPRADFVDSYQGNEVRIQLCDEPVGYYGLRVLWYGQPIGCSRSSRWKAFLDVRQGMPLHPQAPTRQRIIEDDALQELTAWIEERIFHFVCTSVLPDTRLVKTLYQINRERAERECPFAVIQPWYGMNGGASSYYSLMEEVLGEEIVVRKAEAEHMVVLDEEVMALLPESHPAGKWACPKPDPIDGALRIQFDYGIQSLLHAAGLAAYRSVVGVKQTGTLWWKPGVLADPLLATDPGQWGIGTPETSPEHWSSLPPSNQPIYLHADIVSWDIEDAHFVIFAPSKVALIDFLREVGRVAWEPDADREDESEEGYDESVAALIRRYIGDTIASTSIMALLNEVEPFVGERGGVRSIELLYEAERVGELRVMPKRIRLHTHEGFSKELSLD